MNDTSITETIKDSLLGLVDSAVEYTPRIIAAVLLLVVGILISRWVSKLVGGLVEKLQSNKRVVEFMKSLNIKSVNISKMIGMLVKWTIYSFL